MAGFRLLVALLPLLVLLAPTRADACSCVGGLPICQTFWQADAVFAGRVLSIEPITESARNPLFSRKRVRFQVREAWRGGVQGVVEIRTGAGGGDCGYQFERGETYIVYARAHDGMLSTSICARTRKLAQAAEDLEYLKTALRPSATGRIYGTARYQQDGTSRGPDRFVAGYTVTLTGGDRSWSRTTNADGGFEFTGIPAGTYTIELDTPESEHAYGPRDVTLADPRGCALADFYVVPDGRIGVTILGHDATPQGGIRVELYDVDEVTADRPRFPRVTLESDTDGRVEFSQLHPNRYALAINANQPPGIKAPYPPNYFPGADSLTDARHVELATGERIELGAWELPAPLPERQITGVVRWPDGRPAAGASLSLWGARDGRWRARWVDDGSTTTGEDGKFSLIVHEGVTYDLQAYVNVGDPIVQWSVRRESIAGGASTEPLVLVLQPPRGRRSPR